MRTPEEVRQLVQDYVRRFNARDFGTMIEIYAEDATLEDPVGSDVLHGKTAIRAFYDRYHDQASFLQLTGDFRYAAGAVAFSFFCYLGDPADPMVVQITDTFRFDENGFVKEMRAFWGEANVHSVDNRLPGDGGQLSLAGRVALVVGEGQIAAACATELAGMGALVVVAGKADATKATVASIRDAGGRAQQLPRNLSDERGLETLADATVSLAKRLDFCVNALAADGSAARLTALCAGGQLRSFQNLSPHGSIVNVVLHDWSETMPEALRFGGNRTVRINSVVPGVATSPKAIADAVAGLIAGSLDHQVIALGES